jgi:hypothetical protein
MGDNFSDIRNSTIVNRSLVEKAFNKLNAAGDADAAGALRKIAEVVAQSGNKEAGELFDLFNEELTRTPPPPPRKSVLKSSWDGLVKTLPAIAAIAGAVAALGKFWS